RRHSKSELAKRVGNRCLDLLVALKQSHWDSNQEVAGFTSKHLSQDHSGIAADSQMNIHVRRTKNHLLTIGNTSDADSGRSQRAVEQDRGEELLQFRSGFRDLVHRKAISKSR